MIRCLPIDPNNTYLGLVMINSRMMYYFKDCIRGLEGTHISMTSSPNEPIRYIGRNGIKRHETFLLLWILACFHVCVYWVV